MMQAVPITVVGSINRDIVVQCRAAPERGETVTGTALAFGHGGKGANQAFAAARLGGNVAMIARVGQDDYGPLARAALASAGCDVSAIRTAGPMSGQALVLVEGDGSNRIVVIPGANGHFTADELSHDATLLGRGGLLLLQLETPMPTVIRAASLARAGGAQVILDPAPAAGLPQELVALADIITPNRTELEAIAARPLCDGAAVVAAARELRASGPKVVIVKLGAQGCLLLDGDGDGAQWLAAPAVHAVDTTGAGDTFNAGLAVALAQRQPMAVAARFAVAAAALSVTRHGAQASAPTHAEVETLLQRAASEGQ